MKSLIKTIKDWFVVHIFGFIFKQEKSTFNVFNSNALTKRALKLNSKLKFGIFYYNFFCHNIRKEKLLLLFFFNIPWH